MNEIHIKQWKFLKHETPNNLVRVGSINDGGYVTSIDAIRDSAFLISGGISFNTEFEIDFYNINPKALMILIDGSISPIYFILGPIFRKLRGQSFTRAFLRTGQYFFIRKRAKMLKKYISKKKNISYFLEKHTSHGTFGYLKLDIEGSEWEILEDIISCQHIFTGMSIEFHDVPEHINELKSFITKLQHEIIFVEINDVAGFQDGMPKLLEISFLQTKYLARKQSRFNFHLRRPSIETVCPVF